MLVIFAGFRYFPDQGDYSEYYRAFEDVTKVGLESQFEFEPGYMILMWIISWFTNDVASFFVILAMIGVGLNFVGIKRYIPKYVFLAIMCYFVHTYIMREMGAVRAGVAAGICFLSLKYVEECRLGRFILGVICAVCFHLSAIVFFLVYPIYQLNWRVRTMWFILFLCMAIGLIMPLGRVLSTMPFVNDISRLSGYAKDINVALGVFSNPTTLKQLVFISGGLLFYDRLSRKIPHYRVLITSYLLSVCWLMIWNDFPIFSGRFAMYFSVTEIALIPCFLYLFNRYSKYVIISVFILFSFVVLYLNGITYLTKEAGYFPYKMIVLYQ